MHRTPPSPSLPAPLRWFPFWLSLALTTPLFAQNQQVAPVSISLPGGKYVGQQTLSLACATPGATIFYTTDGSVPSENAARYVAPLTISATTPLRARAFAAGFSPSPILTHTYFFWLNHTFPVVSLVFEEKDFFDPATGIYARPEEDLTTVTNIELFENQAQTAAFNQFVETEIQGTASAFLPQKSLDIKPKSSLGSSTVNYRIFPDLPFDKYRRFVLRNGGQDWNIMMFRDEFVTDLVGNLADAQILQKPDLDLQAWRPAVAYFNGQYWGIHNLRERMNRFYVEQHYGLAAGSFDMIENYSEALSGDSIAWFDLFRWLEQTPMNDAANFEKLKQRIDYQNFLDYCALYVYLDNEDWPGNNVRRFRPRQPDAKWRWICYDFDFTLGLYQPGSWNTGDASPDALGRLLNPHAQQWPNPDWATILFRKCWESPDFRRDFTNRMADFMNTIFAPERFSQRLDGFRNLYNPEIAAHFNRWSSGFYEPYWLDNIEKTRRFGAERGDFMKTQLVANSPEATGTANLTLAASPINGGSVRVSTIALGEADLPWTGAYFTGVPIPLRAVAAPGFVFKSWSDPSLGTADSVWVTLAAARTLTAIFQPLAPPCSLVATVGTKTCNDNGTPASATDDTWSFMLTINGLNAGATWTTTLGASVFSGQYDAPETIGQFPISGGPIQFTVRDASDATCAVAVSAAPPPTCSQSNGGATGYCDSRSFYPWHDWISRVAIGNLTKASQKNTYSNFTSLAATVVVGQTVPLSLTAGFSFTTYDEYWRVWADWNLDGQFDPVSEKIFEGILPKPPSGGNVSGTLSGSFSVPSSASPGTARLRVSMKRGGYPEPCETFSNGEVEDYAIVIGNLLGAGNARAAAVLDADALPDFAIFPNPAGEFATLNLRSWAGKNVRAQAYNSLGLVVKTWDFAPEDLPLARLDLSDLSNGHYCLRLSGEGLRPVSRMLLIGRGY